MSTLHEQYHPSISQALKDVREATLRLKEVVRIRQLECQHEHIGECGPLHFSENDIAPPIRVCFECGLSEEGWGPGYKVLTPQRWYVASREKVYAQRQGLAIRNRHKGALIRKEVTVADLINGVEVPNDD